MKNAARLYYTGLKLSAGLKLSGFDNIFIFCTFSMELHVRRCNPAMHAEISLIIATNNIVYSCPHQIFYIDDAFYLRGYVRGVRSFSKHYTPDSLWTQPLSVFRVCLTAFAYNFHRYFFVIVTLVIALLLGEKSSKLMRRFPAN